MAVLATAFAVLLALLHILGLLSAVHALVNCRTASATIAWTISLITFPWASLPLYWVFGRDRFNGYIQALRAGHLVRRRYRDVDVFLKLLEPFRAQPPEDLRETLKVFERLARLPFTSGNRVQLLVDGEETFNSMFEAISAARRYVLVLSFIIQDGVVAQELKRRLIERARAGVRVYLLYDELGSLDLPWAYIRELEAEGIVVSDFKTTKGRANKLQLNFRNHRKILVVDGRVGFTGGVNISDDALGTNPHYGRWRDTHARVEGPAVKSLQFVWCEDWFWATGTVPELDWQPQPAPAGEHNAVYIATGPTDQLAVGLLFFLHCIHSARERIWIASPYFVPDDSVMAALHLAALRGLDVRVILPEKWDFFYMYMAAFSYLSELEDTPVRIYRYRAGYPHQKVCLIDDRLAWVGSANLDNRSMHLNFEGNLLVYSQDFAAEVAAMLEKDLTGCRRVRADEYRRKGFLFKVGVKLVR
ncbi:MAG TPA: cardiolipin synthase, partial [Candidatus Nitrosotenuis sp.]|nr:cardiolipin synthase [Candidatus Nitrosotenuis sp.]